MAKTAEPTTISTLDYFQPLGFGATFGRVFQVFNDRWRAFTTIAFVWYVMGWFFAILLNLILGNDITIDGFSSAVSSTVTVETSGEGSVSTNKNNFVMMQSADEWIFYLIEVLIYYVFTAVAHGASIWIVAHWYIHQHPTLLDAFDVATGKCWTLVGATLLLTALSLVGAIPVVVAVSANIGAGYFFLSFVMVLWVWILSILTYLTYVAVMVEGKGPWGSIRRSFGLIKGYWCEVLGLVLVWVLVKIIIGAILGMILYSGIMSVYNSDNYVLLYFGKFLDTVVGILFLAIAPVFEGVIYMNLRSKSEDFGSVTLGEEIGIGENSYSTMVPTHATRIEETPAGEASTKASSLV
mmetsp:Transcript_8128/g.9304  ORF Transcript_8128/g.9304 Transcript_8128/m.9304 type:complete len:352 (-) Transcript_8128:160-1215(-)